MALARPVHRRRRPAPESAARLLNNSRGRRPRQPRPRQETIQPRPPASTRPTITHRSARAERRASTAMKPRRRRQTVDRGLATSRKPPTAHYVRIGRSWIVAIEASRDSIRVEVLLDSKDHQRNIEPYEVLIANRDLLERRVPGLVFDAPVQRARRKVGAEVGPIPDLNTAAGRAEAVDVTIDRMLALYDATASLLSPSSPESFAEPSGCGASSSWGRGRRYRRLAWFVADGALTPERAWLPSEEDFVDHFSNSRSCGSHVGHSSCS